jgi:hypothetical protein
MSWIRSVLSDVGAEARDFLQQRPVLIGLLVLLGIGALMNRPAVLGLVLGGLLIYGVICYVWFLVKWVGDYPMLLLVVLFVQMLVFGVIGNDYGLTNLFRPQLLPGESWLGWTAFANEGVVQLVAGASVAVLFGWIALVVHLLERKAMRRELPSAGHRYQGRGDQASENDPPHVKTRKQMARLREIPFWYRKSASRAPQIRDRVLPVIRRALQNVLTGRREEPPDDRPELTEEQQQRHWITDEALFLPTLVLTFVVALTPLFDQYLSWVLVFVVGMLVIIKAVEGLASQRWVCRRSTRRLWSWLALGVVACVLPLQWWGIGLLAGLGFLILLAWAARTGRIRPSVRDWYHWVYREPPPGRTSLRRLMDQAWPKILGITLAFYLVLLVLHQLVLEFPETSFEWAVESFPLAFALCALLMGLTTILYLLYTCPITWRVGVVTGFLCSLLILNGTDCGGPVDFKMRYPYMAFEGSAGAGRLIDYYDHPVRLESREYLDGSYIPSHAVLDASRDSPIKIRSAGPHYLRDGDWVQVTGVVGNMNANGLFAITTVDRSHFTLDGSDGQGDYLGGGQWSPVPDRGQISLIGRDPETRNLVITSQDHGLRAGESIMLLGLRDATQLNGKRFPIVRCDRDRFEIPIDGEPLSRYSWGGRWRRVSNRLLASRQGGVISSSHSEPIVIESPRHGLVGGEHVLMERVPFNTNANGVFTVEKQDADHFALLGSWGNSKYGQGGTWRVVTDRGRIDYATNARAVGSSTDGSERAPIGGMKADQANFIWIRSRAHGLRKDEHVEISGVLGNSRANGIFAVLPHSTSKDWFALKGWYGTGNPLFEHRVGGGEWRKVARKGGILAASNTRGATVRVYSPAHGLQAGSRVQIRGVNPRSNLVFTITRIDDDRFELDHSRASGDNHDDYNWDLLRRVERANGRADEDGGTHGDERMGGQWEQVEDRGSILALQGSSEGGGKEQRGLRIQSVNHGLQPGDHVRLSGIAGISEGLVWTVGNGGSRGWFELPDVSVRGAKLSDDYTSRSRNEGPVGQWRQVRDRGMITQIRTDGPEPLSQGVWITSPDHGLHEGDRVVLIGSNSPGFNDRAYTVTAPSPKDFLLVNADPKLADDDPLTGKNSRRSGLDTLEAVDAAQAAVQGRATFAASGAAISRSENASSLAWRFVTGLACERPGTAQAGNSQPLTDNDCVYSLPGQTIAEAIRGATIDRTGTTVTINARWSYVKAKERVLIDKVKARGPSTNQGAEGLPARLLGVIAEAPGPTQERFVVRLDSPVPLQDADVNLIDSRGKSGLVLDGTWRLVTDRGLGQLHVEGTSATVTSPAHGLSPGAMVIAANLNGRHGLFETERSPRDHPDRFQIELDEDDDPWASEEDTEGRGSDQAGPPFRWNAAQLLEDKDVLNTWAADRARWRNKRYRSEQAAADAVQPKLVLVTVSGGGIRSAVWSAVVLRQLEQKIPEFPYHVRLVTGASGGMLGAGYYVASLLPPDVKNPSAPAAHVRGLDAVVNDLASNFLAPVAKEMVFGDLPKMLLPLTQPWDRGQMLEQAWIRRTGYLDSVLGLRFRDLAGGELAGWRPSLVFTPMIVEDGRRLLISNLNLDFAPRNLGPVLIPENANKLTRGAKSQNAPAEEAIDLYSLSAVEFFRLFPRADDFRLSTAIRMSAAFPLVTPAVSLPTNPPRRVVDAGYYDNYGVNLASLWIFQNRGWLVESTSGVVLIQIRDSQGERVRRELNGETGMASGSTGLPGWLRQRGMNPWLVDRASEVLGRIGLGTQWITSPLDGFMSARQSITSFRNDEQLEALGNVISEARLKAGKENEADFLTSVVFECPKEVSVSWAITRQEAKDIEDGFSPGTIDPIYNEGARRNLERLDRLVRWWNRR